MTDLEFQFLDSDGEIIPQTMFPLVVDLSQPQATESDFEFYQYYWEYEPGYGEYEEHYDVEFDYDVDLAGGSCNPDIEEAYSCGEYDFDVEPWRLEGLTLFTDRGIKLEPVEFGGDGVHFEFYHYAGEEPAEGESSEIEFNIYGDVDTIYFADLDADDDGITDDVDACPASLTDESVMFGEYDAGVTNHVDEDGCTIMDHYAACEADQEGQSFTRRSRSFYRGPSYCEKQVAYGLVSDGVIDYSEARLLRDTLYQSHR